MLGTVSEGAVSTVDHFWQYAREATLLACNAETDDVDKQGLFGLARTWTQAALLERRTSSRDHNSQLDAKAA